MTNDSLTISLSLQPTYGSPSPFFPFFFGGLAWGGRVAGGGGASIFGVAGSDFGCALPGGGCSSVFGGGGSVTCSSLGSVDAAGKVFSSFNLSASAVNSARSAAHSR